MVEGDDVTVQNRQKMDLPLHLSHFLYTKNPLITLPSDNKECILPYSYSSITITIEQRKIDLQIMWKVFQVEVYPTVKHEGFTILKMHEF